MSLTMNHKFKDFDQSLRDAKLGTLLASGVNTFQINLGRLCNLACRHCHVEAGPRRREIMSRETLEECLAAIDRCGITEVDLTGGAPEMNPSFRWFVEQCRARDINVIDRSNLVIMLEKGYEDLPQFLKQTAVEIVASLPCYTQENVDRQRGRGVFERSIRVLRSLNELGWADESTGLRLHLVYNPIDTVLPGDQRALEEEYHRQLGENFGVRFNSLLTITNMPIGRFETALHKTGEYNRYMNLLIDSFNPSAVRKVMCRELVSISWDGLVYDCDFNQMLDLPCGNGRPYHIREFNSETMDQRKIVTGLHCYGCTAGAGSSCSGALTDNH